MARQRKLIVQRAHQREGMTKTGSPGFWSIHLRKELPVVGYATRDETRAADVSLSNAAGEVLRSRQGSRRHRKDRRGRHRRTAAETVGAMEAMNEMTLEYSKTRYIGQPIGSYQVVQHRLSDMFMARNRAAAWRCWRRCR